MSRAANETIPPTTLSRFRACLLGGAAGDALGAPVEFLTGNDIRQQHGPDGLTAFHPAYGRLGAITDDTQMSMFTAEGLLRAWAAARGKVGAQCRRQVARAYMRWYQTQNDAGRQRAQDLRNADGYLLQQPELYARRGPGNTCMSALSEMRRVTKQA